MQVGVLLRWGGIVAGREKAAVALFDQGAKLFSEKLNDGTFTYFEPFLYMTGDYQEEAGFFLVKGDDAKVRAFFDLPDTRSFLMQVEIVVNHLKFEFLHVGDAISQQMQILGAFIEEKTPALV